MRKVGNLVMYVANDGRPNRLGVVVELETDLIDVLTHKIEFLEEHLNHYATWCYETDTVPMDNPLLRALYGL